MAPQTPSQSKEKCLYYDSGFCRYKDKCRKEHMKTVCEDSNCDKKCEKRHPKQCRYREKCKFHKKDACDL